MLTEESEIKSKLAHAQNENFQISSDSKTVSHNIYRILKVTEIQRIRSNQLMTKNR